MSTTCPYCDAPKTNRGRLHHYGRYTGYACRTWVADEGGANISEVCKSRKAFNKLAARKAATTQPVSP